MDKIGSVDDKQQQKLVKRGMSAGKQGQGQGVGQGQQGGVGRGGGPKAKKPRYLFDEEEEEEEELHLMRVEREEDEEEESTSNDSKDVDQLQQQQQQTTTTTPDGSSSGTKFPLRRDLQLMMYGLGDCRRPLTSTLEQVETVLKQQMTSLLQLAAEVRTRCQSKGNQMQPQHFLYLLARDKVKLRRLLRYLCLKDARARLMNESDGTESGIIETQNEEENEEDGEPEAEGKDGSKSGKKAGPRRQICYKFLKRIDQTGELMSQLYDEHSEDEVKMQRHVRLEHQTRFMDTKGYLEFSEARTASFGRKSQVNIFSEWVASLLPGFTFHPVAMEILSYLAFETVAQLVDLTLLVKNERSHWNDVYSSKNKKQKTSEDGRSEFLSMCAIQPNEIQEAMRRFHKPNGAMAVFAKSYTTPLRRKLLCL